VYQYLVFDKVDNPVWTREDYPILFTEIDWMDDEIAEAMRENYPFFQWVHSEVYESSLWANCCMHCGALQEDDGDYMYGTKGPFSPWEIEQAMEIRVIYFKLKFDYCISAGYSINPLLENITR